MAAGAFDLVLAYPQWQGSARHTHLPRGARAAAEICAAFGPVEAVSLSEAEGDGPGIRRWDAIFAQFKDAQAILARRRPRRLLTAGGDCAVDIAAIDYLHGLHPDLTVIWIDAHLDANTPETSPSGSFHGMPVTAILGHAPAPMREKMGAPIPVERFRYVGVRVGDDGEQAFRREHGLALFDPGMPLTGPVHIHFDLDVLEPTEFPYLAWPEANGLAVADAIALVRRIARESDVVGLTITEFAPANEEDAREGGKVIAALCEAVVRKNED